MALFRKAQRAKAKLRLGIAGPSGAGKTYSALLIASGIASWDKIAVIDTENGSADLYAHLGEYSVLTLHPPYSIEKYIDAIKAAENEGFEVVIIDSLTHAWAGEGGILDQQGKAADTKYRGNSWSAWREFTPKHNALVEAMLKSKCHVIATLRSKTEYVQVTENGKTVIKKVGMAPIQRDGMEYEFTLFFDINTEHVVSVSKDRTSMFDGQYFMPSSETGKKLLEWLESGVEPTPQQQKITQETRQQIARLAKDLGVDAKFMSALIMDRFHVLNSADLTEAQGKELVSYMQTMKAAGQIAATTSDDAIIEAALNEMEAMKHE